MLKARLLRIVPESRKYIAANIIFQWISLAANIAMMTSVATLLADLYTGRESGRVMLTLAIAAAAIVVRFVCTILASKMSFLSSKAVKKTLRGEIYEKLRVLALLTMSVSEPRRSFRSPSRALISSRPISELMLPQFLYALLAPLTLFVYLSRIN